MEILSDATFKGDATFKRNVTFNKLVTIENSEIITGSLIPSGATITGSLGVDGAFSFTPKGNPCSPILKISSYNNGVKSVSVGSDATFGGATTFNKGVEINGGGLSVACGESVKFIINEGGISEFGHKIFDNKIYIKGDLELYKLNGGSSAIILNGVSICNWSDLNDFLSFAPASLSTTVSSNTSKINSACSTISSLCTTVSSLCTTVSSNTTKINSLCTKVDSIRLNPKHTFANPTLPIGCTKFYFVDNVMDNGGYGNDYYKFRVNSTGTIVSSFQVFKGGDSGTNEEVQIDIKQHTSGNNRWFEGTLASNTTGYDESEFIIVFDEFKEMYPESVPQ